MKQRISLTMIVKNEAAHLVNCLESVKNAVDEIIIVDTGSDDDTITIARSYTPNIYSFPWINDFSAARNFAINQASGDWILALDADEELEFKELDSLHTLVNYENDKEAFLLPLLNPLSPSTLEYNTFSVLRLFKNHKDYRYVGKIHEQVTLPNQQKVGLVKDPIIKHTLPPPKKLHEKRSRNLKLLTEVLRNDPHNPFQNYYMGVEWLMLGKPSSALPFIENAYYNLNDDQLFFRTPALKYLLLSLKELGRFDEALSLCLEVSLKYPHYTDLFYLGGLLFEEKKEYSIALKWFNHAILCGTPSVRFSHLTGSGSFLAYYHLGFCYEKLGKSFEARAAFENALKLNPKYHYPLYSLFINLLKEKGSTLCYEHLKNLEFLEDPMLCLTSADLFFQSDHAEQAYYCLETHKEIFSNDERFSFYYGKYCVYTGRFETGLKALSQLAQQSSHYDSAQLHSLTALLLLGDFEQARSLALILWKDYPTRGNAYLFLWLLRFIQNHTLPTIPLTVRDRELLEIAVELFVAFKHFKAYDFNYSPYADSYNQGLKTLIKSTEKGVQWLLSDYTQSLIDLKNRFITKYGTKQLRINL